MRTFPIVFSLLLSQAFYATADEKVQRRLVRNHEQAVEADGTAHAFASATATGNVAMGVSASGQMEVVEENPSKKAKNTHQAKTRGQSLLSEIQEMARSGAAPEPDKIKIIKKLVQEELEPDLQATRDLSVTQIGIEHEAIVSCNGNGTARQQEISTAIEVTVGERRTEHASCREDEKEKNSTQGEKCTQLDNFLNLISVPANIPHQRPREGMVQYVKTMSGYFCSKGPEVTDLDDACTEALNENAKHKAKCDRLQASFELSFCTWRADLLNACRTLSQCYEGAVKIYNNLVADTKELVKKWKVEYAALKKILCYVDVWLNNGDVDTVDADQYDSCNGAEVDTSPMDINYPAVPAQAKCDTTAVKNYPSTPAFATAEYAAFIDYVNEALACIEVKE